MFFSSISSELLERIVFYLDISSALSFIQVNKYVFKTFEKNYFFWMDVAKYIGIEFKKTDSADDIKKRFLDWKTGKKLSVLSFKKFLF